MRSITLIVKIFFLSYLSTYFGDCLTSNRNYSDLIYNVHKYFGTSCVFLVHNRQEDFDEFYRIETMLREFSAQSVLAVAVEFGRLGEVMAYYSERVVRSLIVVNLRTREVVAKFVNFTSYHEMQTSCWLLLFEEEVYLENYDDQPGKNMFHIRFDTEMLVARSNQSTIQEWYWLSNRVKMEDFAVWDSDTGFTLRTDESLYERRVNLENSRIAVTAVNNPPMTSFRNNKMDGLFGNIFRELSRVANFNVDFITPPEMSYGSWNSKEKRWTGMIQMLVSGNASIAAADFTMTTLRLEWVDFSLPLISTYDKLYIKRPEGGICWSAYWQTFAPGIWIIIQVLILFTTLLLTLITAVRRYRITPDVFVGYFLLVLGIYCQQGLPDFPTDLPSRIAYFSIFLSALIVSAAYGAALVSFLTVTGLTLPFTTLEEFVEDGTYKLIVFRDGAEYDMFTTATEPTLVQMSLMMNDKAMLPMTLQEGFEQVCNEKVAFYVPAALEESIRLTVPCKVVGIGTKRSMSLAMALSKGNPFNGLINYHVQRFRDCGILDRIKHQFTVGMNPPKSTHSDVTLWGVVPILAVLGGGVLLAIFIIFLEKQFFAKQSRESIKEKERQKLGPSRNEEFLKIRLRNREKYSTPSSNFYP